MLPLSSTVFSLTPEGFHKMHYLEWGDSNQSETVFCVHGLSRNAHDFDFLASALSCDFRLLCPDIIGRGKSDWANNSAYYSYPQYLADMTALIARSNADKIHWIGTSMGGIMGLLLAIQPNSPIQSLIINDIGAFIPSDPLSKIIHYVKNPPHFPTKEKGGNYLRQILASFGSLSEDQWLHLAEHGLEPHHEGGYRLAYDPRIVDTASAEAADLWYIWEQIQCPVLLIRGERSEVFPKDVLSRMKEIKPHIDVVEFSNTGHAPSLMDPQQIEVIHQWLKKQAST